MTFTFDTEVPEAKPEYVTNYVKMVIFLLLTFANQIVYNVLILPGLEIEKWSIRGMILTICFCTLSGFLFAEVLKEATKKE